MAAKGENIFRYEGSNEAELSSKIDALNEEIQKAIAGKSNLFTSDIQALDNQINNRINALYKENNIQNILEHKKDIDYYITKKAQIAGSLNPADSYINGLIAQKTQYQNEIAAGSEVVKAASSGVVSYRIDNLENQLNTNNLDSLDSKILDALKLKTGQIVVSSDKICKIVNNFNCYIAAALKSSEAKNAKQGDVVHIRLSTGNTVPAVIYSIKGAGNGNFFTIFNISQDVEKLINYRKISIDVIWWEESGYKIPNSAIIYNNGLSYVVRNRAGYSDKILVEIVKSGNNYSIVKNYTADDLKNLNFSSSDIKNMQSISIYDEIFLNPDLNKIN